MSAVYFAFEPFGRYDARVIRSSVRKNPLNINVNESSGVDKRLVRISRGSNFGFAPVLNIVLFYKIKHCLYAKGRALRRV